MAVATRAHGVWQEHAIEPAVDDAVTGAKGDTAALGKEIRQVLLGLQVHWFGVGGGVAKALHHQVSGKAQAGQLLHFVPRHGPRGVLTANGGHQRLTACAGTDAWKTAGFTHHLLSQGEALAGVGRSAWPDERFRRGESTLAAHFVGKSAANHQWDATASTNFVADRARLEVKSADHRAVAFDRAGVGANRDHITGV